MEITAEMVKELRNTTGVQMMTCKKALQESDGDMEKAKLALRKMGIEASENRSGKDATSGIIYQYNHDNRVGVMVELRCETDFVAKNEEFQELAKTIAMHIAWAKPIAVDKDEIKDETWQTEYRFAQSQVPDNKPPEIVEKIVEGKMNKFCKKVCLLQQDELQVSEGKSTIGDMIKALSGKLTEKIEVKQFVRYELGE